MNQPPSLPPLEDNDPAAKPAAPALAIAGVPVIPASAADAASLAAGAHLPSRPRPRAPAALLVVATIGVG
jgi:hypothetical protein